MLRHDGVLKRIRTTPLPPGAYIGGLLASTVATAIGITAATGLIGWLAFGAAPRGGEVPALAGGLVLGTVCFAVLGLAVSSVITSAESAVPSPTPASCRSRSSPAFSTPPSAGCQAGCPGWCRRSRSRRSPRCWRFRWHS